MDEMCKDLAYSQEQLQEFLRQMQGVTSINATTYMYDEVCISLKDQSENLCLEEQKGGQRKEQRRAQEAGIHAVSVLRPLPRCYMHLKGPKEQAEKFYKKFMLHHMTMGG